MSSIKYRPEIDGLRAIAVVPVILFHMDVSWLPGGFIGVDVFFVISGYLITSIIMKEQQRGEFTFAAFWARRVRRILPVLLAVTFLTLIVSYLFGYRNEFSALRLQSVAALLSVANVYMYRMAGDYWGPAAENSPFLHCWSLSVEEQFYIVYPLFLFWLLQKKKQFVLPIIGLMVVGSFALFLYAYTRLPAATFYLLPTRIWELGAGCLLALLSTRMTVDSSRWHASILSALGLALILASYVFMPSGSIGIKLLLPVLGATLFIAFGQSKQGVGRLLSLPAVVYIGNISYSLYVWHWPVIVLAHQMNPATIGNLMYLAVLSALILFLSILSYHFIESPLRRSPKTLKAMPWAFAACLMLAGVGTFIASNDGNAYDTSAYNQVAFQGLKYNVGPDEKLSPEAQKKFSGIKINFRDPGQDKAFANEGIVKRYGSETPDVLLIGDSHAGMWSAVIDDVCREKGLTVSFFGANGVSPFLDIPLNTQLKGALGFTAQQKRQFDIRRLECIKQWKPLVILAVRWSRFEPSEYKQMVDVVGYIGQCGAKVLLVEQPPEVALNGRNSAQYLSYLGYMPSKNGQKQLFPQGNCDRVAQGREYTRQLSQKFPFCRILKTHDYYAPDTKNAYIFAGRDILYMDDDHLSNAGAFQIRSRFNSAISSLIVSKTA